MIRVLVSFRVWILAMAHLAIRHGNGKSRTFRTHVTLDSLPDVQNLPAAKRPKIVASLEKNAVLQSITDGSRVVLDSCRQLFGSQVGLVHLRFSFRSLPGSHDAYTHHSKPSIGSTRCLSSASDK